MTAAAPKGGEPLVSEGSDERTAVAFDPYPLWLTALEQLAKQAGLSIVGVSTEPAAVLELVAQRQPAMLISGTDSRDAAILAYFAEAKRLAPRIKVVVISHLDDDAAISAAFAAGADMYILKSATPDDLASALRQAFRASFFVPAREMLEPASLIKEDALLLTHREREILRLVAEGHTNATMAKMLWVSEQTIKFHLSNIYRKVGVTNRTGASRWAQVHGLLPDSFAMKDDVA